MHSGKSVPALLGVAGLLVMLPTASPGAEKCRDVPSVRHVTVYPESAVLVRSQSLELSPGAKKEILIDLPHSASATSIQLLQAAHQPIDLAHKVAEVDCVPDTAALEAEKAKLQKKDAPKAALQQKAEVRLGGIDELLKRMGSIRDRFIDSVSSKAIATKWPVAPEATKPDQKISPSDAAKALDEIWTSFYSKDRDWQKLEAKIREERNSVLAEIEKVKKSRADLVAKIAAKTAEIAKLGKARKVHRVAITAKSKTAFAGSIRIRHAVAAASWQPRYLVKYSKHARDGTSNVKVAIEHVAHVAQNTGEDWENVKIALAVRKDKDVRHLHRRDDSPVTVNSGNGVSQVVLGAVLADAQLSVLATWPAEKRAVYLSGDVRAESISAYGPGNVEVYWDGELKREHRDALPWHLRGKQVLVGPVPGFTVVSKDKALKTPVPPKGYVHLRGAATGKEITVSNPELPGAKVRIAATVPQLDGEVYALQAVKGFSCKAPCTSLGEIIGALILDKDGQAAFEYGFSVLRRQNLGYAW